MPELPEVQTVVNDLQEVIGHKITGFISTWPKAIKKTNAKKLARDIVGKKIISIERIGKNIFITLSNKSVIGLHLKMTGKLLIMEHGTENIEQETKKHLHHVFYLQKNKSLEFHDIRKFATITLYSPAEVLEIKSKLGIDPATASFTEKLLAKALLKKTKLPIKQVIMDQTVVVGIGNIYASEILFEAKILPNRTIATLSTTEFKKLFLATKKILAKAIRLRGTSVSDYRDAKGQKGEFQNHLKVYKKNTQKCQKCDTIIVRTLIGQRSTYYCPKCQV